MILRSFITFCLIVILGFTTACKDEPYVEPVTIAAFGDSLMAGHDIEPTSAFPAQLQARLLADGYRAAKVLNFGVSGDSTQNGLQRVDSVIAANPDIVILELGANDFLRRSKARDATDNLNKIITRLLAAEIDIVLAGIRPPAIFSIGRNDVADYGSMYKNLSEAHNLPLYNNFLDGAMGNPKLMLEDGMHPNADGVAVMVDNIYPTVLDAIAAHAKRQK